MDSILTIIHQFFFCLTDDIQNVYCSVFEKCWTKEIASRDNYAPNMCLFLMTKVVKEGKSFSSYMNRLYSYRLDMKGRNAIRESFKLIDFSNSQSDGLKKLILYSLTMNRFFAHTHGKKLLTQFLILNSEFPRDCLHSLQTCLLSMPASSLRKWGDIIIAADLACTDEEYDLLHPLTRSIRSALERDMIQELLNICIHASDPHTFLSLKTLIGTFVHCRKHKVLWNRLTELYEPIIFRALAAINSLVRRHAVVVFTDCFPLGNSEVRDSYSIEEQFKSILVQA